MVDRSEVDGLNAGYAALVLEQYLDNPAAVPRRVACDLRVERSRGARRDPGPAWPGLLERFESNGANGHAGRRARPLLAEPVPCCQGPPPPPAGPLPRLQRRLRPSTRSCLAAVAAAASLVKGLSHARPPGGASRSARPRSRRGDPALEPERLIPKLTPRAAGSHPRPSSCASTVEGEDASPTRCRACARSTCGTIAYEIEHISDHEERVWLRQAIESRPVPASPLSADERVRLLNPAEARVEGMELYFAPLVPRPEAVSRSRGLDVMVPMLDESIELASEAGAPRGRHRHGASWPPSTCWAHIVGRPYEVILSRVRGRAHDRGRRRERRGAGTRRW